MFKPANRVAESVTFHAVEFAKKAQVLREAGRDIISLSIGEPDFTAPPLVCETLIKATENGLSGYSATLGLEPLRLCIADYYNEQFGSNISHQQVIITTGASGALLLAAQTLLNPGDEVLMPDPYYPANFNFILTAGATTKLIPCTPENRFQLSAENIKANWGPKTRAVLIASPSNPTGTSITEEELAKICATVKSLGGIVILDEIYLGLSYDHQAKSGLAHDPEIVVINSFSKFFNMTGWRLGWIIAPEHLVPAFEKISSSLTICAPTLAQHAAISCFAPESMAIYEKRRAAFKERRDYLLPELARLGIEVPVKPDGAFYIYCDISKFSDNSVDFANQLLEKAGIATVPGLDFGPAHAKKMLRLSYATGIEQLKIAVQRLEDFLGEI
ncbi:pyridoxal phosphate-dependent aminotransferase [Oligella urethralis]|uniref:pyridoxal phosphate-dependent aminotransferase n=1 Tax=Oligella urethralis TaxID=90245 RepID=UPI000C9AFDDC|nr:pyridoxal phosphate-dependent aminotransferase [Oligella urethralis]MDK6202266.1 pyridoxal phosphate-dependent aminotransferase [Oligella urethralis]PMC18287.1 aminotransferase [Oligella urethralis]